MSHLVSLSRRARNTDEFAPRRPFPVGTALFGLIGLANILSVSATLFAQG